tara:strand:+ start:568 stop:1143 length:576 start_codon:yes stop_codon:yes gene_type:complete
MTTISINQKNNKNLKKLHLGCGDIKIPNYINIDSRKTKATDKIHDIKDLSIFENDSIDEIYACHVLEHFGRFEVNDILKNWYKVLKKNGILRIAVPDFESICFIYNNTNKISLIEGPVIGGQTYKNNFHYNIFDYNKLKNILLECGYKAVERYNWRETDHSDIDDYSQAYIPHMQKENGKLISLNVKCQKS